MNVEEIEELRKKTKNTIVFGVIFSVIGAVLIAAVTKATVTAFIGFIGIIVTAIKGYKDTKKFKLAFKQNFVLKGLEEVFTDVRYEPENGLGSGVIASTRMIEMGNTYDSNDLVYAKYKDVKVVQADVHIQEEYQTTDKDGNTRTQYRTLFKGKWMVFDFNKKFKLDMQIREKGFPNACVSNWGNSEKFKKIKMEDETFNDKFRIYAQSEHEAFYILTPQLMEKIKKFENGVKGKVIFCFVDNKLHVGIHNNSDSFEHSIFRRIVEKDVMEKISREISLVASVIDELDLDNDLFRGEV